MLSVLPGIRSLIPQFDAFLVDLWGVVHDGERPFEGVASALDALAAAKRRVLFMTNTSRTGDAVADTLVQQMGIARALFSDVVTAGDVTRRALLDRDPALFAGLPKDPRCYHFGDPDFVPWVFELELTFTDSVTNADLVIATGAARDADALADARAHLAPAAARKAPLVCTNPDRIIPTAEGPRFGPGAVAHAYAELGAPVFLYGKPHPPIYAEARRRLGDIDGRRIIAIGDTLGTDIRGAASAGYASMLVVGSGVHAPELSDRSVMNDLFAREGVTPDFVVERFHP